MPIWRIIVSTIGPMPPDYTTDRIFAKCGFVEERSIDTETDANHAASAFRAAAEMLRVTRGGMPPYVQIYLDDLTVLEGYKTATLEWPFPAFFWRWADKYSTETRARLDPVTTGGILPRIIEWAELGKKIRLIYTEDRRFDLRILLLSLLSVIPDLGLQPADKERLYTSTARIAWLSAQPDMILTPQRQKSLDDVLSTLDALIRPSSA